MRSLTGLNSEFSFSQTGCHGIIQNFHSRPVAIPRLKRSVSPTIQSIAGERIIEFIPFRWYWRNECEKIRLGFELEPPHPFVMFWPSTRPPKMLFQGDVPEGRDTFQWPVIERDRVGGLRLIIWDKVKVPLCQYRLMHRKRVTSELHDSYFRLMTIKHSISKIQWAIVWALNYYLTQLSSSPRAVANRIPDSWRLDVVWKATPDRGGPRIPRWSLGSREDADKMQ